MPVVEVPIHRQRFAKWQMKLLGATCQLISGPVRHELLFNVLHNFKFVFHVSVKANL